MRSLTESRWGFFFFWVFGGLESIHSLFRNEFCLAGELGKVFLFVFVNMIFSVG